MAARINQALKDFAIKAPHVFYSLPMLVVPLSWYAYRRSKWVQLPPETVIPFRQYYYVVRPQDVTLTDENALAYNWEDVHAYRDKHFPHMDKVPGIPMPPSVFDLKPYPRVKMEVDQKLESV